MKKLFFILTLTGITLTASSQSFMHGVGINLMGSSDESNYENDFGIHPGITYSPRFNFLENEKLSVSVGIPLSIGLSMTYSQSPEDIYGYYYENVSSGLYIKLPVLINVNMGRGATKKIKSKFGWFAGAGYGFFHADYVADVYNYVTDEYIESYSSNTHGPVANAGVRFGIGRKHQNLELKLTYMKGIKDVNSNFGSTMNKSNFFAFSTLFNF